MPAPDAEAVTAYLESALGSPLSWDEDAISGALAAEQAAQAKRCRVPAAEDEWPADLAEALCRRVAHNLALRPLTLGLQATVTEGAALSTSVGGTDAEVRRLEAPYRRLVIA